MKRTLLVLLILASGNLFAQSSPDQLINRFFETYKKDAGKAVKELWATNKWSERSKDDIDKIIGTVNGFTEDYMGKYYGQELIATKKFSESFVLYSYLVKYDRQPIRFIFKFYKPNDQWVLYAYSFDDQLDNEIQESAKLYYLNLDDK
jgi:accessory colonization factor AcfC